MASVVGVLIEDDGEEYLVTVDDRDLPDLLKRQADGTWGTTKARGRSKNNAKTTAQRLLRELGQPAHEDHTQQLIKRLIVHSVTVLVRRFFSAARW